MGLIFLVLVNGSPHGFFKATCGSKQGDHLSPYLFLIITEGLSNLIKQAILQGELEGMRISNHRPRVTHLLFVDNSLLFCKANVRQVQCIKRIISQYELCSGQKINMDKSTIFFSKSTNEASKQTICDLLNGVAIKTHSKYLGLPMVLGRYKRSVFDFYQGKNGKEDEKLEDKVLKSSW